MIYVESIKVCCVLMRSVNEVNDYDVLFNVFDIGGGFLVDYDCEGIDIESFCVLICVELLCFFEDWEIMVELGRYFVVLVVMSLMIVVGKLICDDVCWYYLDDGVYGLYLGLIYDYVCYLIQVMCEG